MPREFIRQLFADGRAVILSDKPPTTAELAADEEWILAWEPDWRQTLTGSPPQIDRAVLRWAVAVIDQTARFLAYKHLPEAPLPAQPEVRHPAAHYSADLVLRFLPEFIRLTRALSPGGFLERELLTIAAKWPLSSVGIANLPQPLEPVSFWDDPCLQRLYLDRIMATQDESRLADPRVREALRSDVGLHSELAGKLKVESVCNAPLPIPNDKSFER